MDSPRRYRLVNGVEQDFNDGLDRIAEMHVPTVLLPVIPSGID